MLRRDDRERGSRTKVTELKVEKSLILQKLKNFRIQIIANCLFFVKIIKGTMFVMALGQKKSFPNFRFFMIFVIFLILNNNSQRKLKLLHPL